MKITPYPPINKSPEQLYIDRLNVGALLPVIDQANLTYHSGIVMSKKDKEKILVLIPEIVPVSELDKDSPVKEERYAPISYWLGHCSLHRLSVGTLVGKRLTMSCRLKSHSDVLDLNKTFLDMGYSSETPRLIELLRLHAGVRFTIPLSKPDDPSHAARVLENFLPWTIVVIASPTAPADAVPAIVLTVRHDGCLVTYHQARNRDYLSLCSVQFSGNTFPVVTASLQEDISVWPSPQVWSLLSKWGLDGDDATIQMRFSSLKWESLPR